MWEPGAPCAPYIVLLWGQAGQGTPLVPREGIATAMATAMATAVFMTLVPQGGHGRAQPPLPRAGRVILNPVQFKALWNLCFP